jgi:hypothetical protein
MIREDVYAAVFAFFAGLVTQDRPLFKLATRKPSTWEGVSPDDQPALLMRQKREQALRKKGLPTVWTFHLELLLYVHTGAQNDSAIIPAEILNPLLDAIEASLAVDDQSNAACTLGGLVSHCAINGDIEIFSGDLGDEAVAIVPIEILVNG